MGELPVVHSINGLHGALVGLVVTFRQQQQNSYIVLVQAHSPDRPRRVARTDSDAGATSFRARLSALEAMGQQPTPRTPLLRRASSRLGSIPVPADQPPQGSAAEATTPTRPAPTRGGLAQLSSAPTPGAGSARKQEGGAAVARRRNSSHDGSGAQPSPRPGTVRDSQLLPRQSSAPVWPPLVIFLLLSDSCLGQLAGLRWVISGILPASRICQHAWCARPPHQANAASCSAGGIGAWR